MNEEKAKAAEYLRDQLSYCQETGVMTWKIGSEKSTRSVAELADDGYLMVKIKVDGVQRRFMLHRLAWFMVHGVMPEGEIDHINGDRQDNRLSNLRDVCRSENCRNAAKRKDNTSGVSGVYWDKRLGAWRASVRADGARHYVGVFHDLSIAENAVADFRKARGFSERHGT